MAGFFCEKMIFRNSKTHPLTGESLWQCTCCKEWMPQDKFSKDTRAKSGLNSICRCCQKWRMKKRNYGITQQQYDVVFKRQGGVCAVCKCSPLSNRCRHGHLVVDHCHASGYVRGLLCERCNATLGESMDNISSLQALIDYIKHPPALQMKIKP